jgi:hypothetical protein
MRQIHSAARRPVRLAARRRGVALLLVLVLTIAFAALALSASMLTGSAGVLGNYYEREEIGSNATDAALALGKARLNADPDVLPDTGYAAIISNGTITGADGQTVSGITMNVYVGPTGSANRQTGRFASIVADVRDAYGGHWVRRLEVSQESFAKFAYWSNSESGICFGSGDQLLGPVFSNDVIHTCSGQAATFWDTVSTAQYVDNAAGVNGVFKKGYRQYVKPMSLPNTSRLARLIPLAASGNVSFTAPNTGTMDQVAMRIEFVAIDLDGDGDASDPDEGFIRVYQADAGNGAWVRGNYQRANCGVLVPDAAGTKPGMFIPDTVRWGATWVSAALQAYGTRATFADSVANTATFNTLRRFMSLPGARCYPGGDNHLYPYLQAGATVGGTDSSDSFVPVDARGLGHWLPWPGAVDPRLAAAGHAADAPYLFPISSLLNPGYKGVITVNGTVAVNGVSRGRETLYATGNIVIVDDLRYNTDPSLGTCNDVMGMISLMDIMPADNGINMSQPYTNAAGVTAFKMMDDNNHTFVQSTVMALGTSWGAQNPNSGPTASIQCGLDINGNPYLTGRGCLYLTGSLIQAARKNVNSGATNYGYAKRYQYDMCVISNPPPHFPTTGNIADNRYYELDPIRFDVSTLYADLQPNN